MVVAAVLAALVGIVLLVAQLRVFAIHEELVKIRQLLEKQNQEPSS